MMLLIVHTYKRQFRSCRLSEYWYQQWDDHNETDCHHQICVMNKYAGNGYKQITVKRLTQLYERYLL